MPNDVVLPETLVAALIANVGEVGASIDARFTKLAAERERIRNAILAANYIEEVQIATIDKPVGIAVDGACAVKTDRACSYGFSCVATIGPDQSFSDYLSSIFILPHLPSAGSLSTGFMMMQEIIMAVDAANKYPNDIVFIDGSKITAIIKVNQFYSCIADELPEILNDLRDPKNLDDSAKILRKFESKNWFKEYIRLPNIVGMLKLVTTTTLIESYYPDGKGQFDDKTLAALVLEKNECIKPIGLKSPHGENSPLDPYHIHKSYPFSNEFSSLSRELVTKNQKGRLFHMYLRAPHNDCIYKLEVNNALGKERCDQAIAWVIDESPAVDIKEPYLMFIVDKFVSEAVSVSNNALEEISRSSASSAWAWYFTGPYRT